MYLWSLRHLSVCLCVCVFCVFHHPFPPLPCVCKAIYNILYVNCAVQKQAKQKQKKSSSVSAWSHCTRLQCCNISTSPFAFSACLLLAHKAHVHAVGRHSPRCLPQAMIRDSHSFLCKTLKHIIQDLIWKCDLRARDSASVCVCEGARQYYSAVCLHLDSEGMGTRDCFCLESQQSRCAALGTFTPTSLGVQSFTHTHSSCLQPQYCDQQLQTVTSSQQDPFSLFKVNNTCWYCRCGSGFSTPFLHHPS